MQQILNLKQIELKTKFEYGQKVWCICDNRPFKSKINNINVNVIGGIDFVIKRIDITYKLNYDKSVNSYYTHKMRFNEYSNSTQDTKAIPNNNLIEIFPEDIFRIDYNLWKI